MQKDFVLNYKAPKLLWILNFKIGCSFYEIMNRHWVKTVRCSTNNKKLVSKINTNSAIAYDDILGSLE